MHIFSMICVAIGITAAIAYHYRSSTAHFQSLHSWFGLGTMSLFALQFVIGFFAYAWPKLPFEARKSSVPVHQFLGMVIFFMACATACLGIAQKIVNIQLRAAADGKPIPPVGPEVQLAHWAAIGIAILFALVSHCAPFDRRREPARVLSTSRCIRILRAPALSLLLMLFPLSPGFVLFSRRFCTW
jgi:hypothetical protein